MVGLAYVASKKKYIKLNLIHVSAKFEFDQDVTRWVSTVLRFKLNTKNR